MYLLLLVETAEWRRAAARVGVALVFALLCLRSISSETKFMRAPIAATTRPNLNIASSCDRRMPPIARNSDATNAPLKTLKRTAEPTNAKGEEKLVKARARKQKKHKKARKKKFNHNIVLCITSRNGLRSADIYSSQPSHEYKKAVKKALTNDREVRLP